MRGVIIRKYLGVLEDPGQAGSRVRPEMTPGDVFLRVLCIKSVIPGGVKHSEHLTSAYVTRDQVIREDAARRVRGTEEIGRCTCRSARGLCRGMVSK